MASNNAITAALLVNTSLPAVGKLHERDDPIILEWSHHLSAQETSPPAIHDIEARRQSEADVYKGLRIYVVTFLVLTAFPGVSPAYAGPSCMSLIHATRCFSYPKSASPISLI